jgi:hypothetical protein
MAINSMGTLPPELFAEQQALNRQQQMAQLLMQQGQQMPQGQMVSGRFVAPSFFQNLAPLVQSYVGTKLAEKGDKQAVELAKKLREGQGEAVANYIGQLQGRLAVPERVTEMAGPYGQGVGESGANIPMPTATIPARPAIQANPLLANMNVLQDPYAPDFLKQQAMTQLTRGPKWKEVTEFNQKTGNTETYRYDENSPNPRDTLQFIAINKPAISPETQVRFADEGISIPQQFRGGAVSAGQPTMQPQGQPMGQAGVQPVGTTQTTPVGAPSAASSQGYDYFKAPPPPAGLTGKQAREFVSEQNKPLTGKPAEQVTGAVNYQKSLDKVQNLLDTYKGPQLLDPNVRAQFKAAIRTAQLQGKEAFGLGVLNGPDLDILEQVISDPTAFDAFLKDRSTINKLYNNQREFTSEAIKTNYRASQKAIPSNLRQYVEIRPKELTNVDSSKPKSAGQIARAMLNNEPIIVKNNQWVYEKTGKPVQ